MQNNLVIAEKNGSRILHRIGNARSTHLALQVADEDWKGVLTFSKEEGLAQIAALKKSEPFTADAWKFELVDKSQFELDHISAANRWFRIKPAKAYPNLRSPEIGRTGFSDIKP